MDFESERYVRVYTRDTVTWSLLPWQAQAVFMGLLRKVDRAGVLDLGGHSPADAVAAILRWPLEAVEPAIVALRDRGCIEVGDDAIVLPRFLEAQEAKQSDSHRQRESRARRRDLARRQPVTKRDTDERSPVATVTNGHTLSQPVTPSLAEPTKPSRTNQSNGPLTLVGEADPPPADPIVPQVLEAMREAVRDVTGGRDRGPRDSPGNRDLIRKCTRREGATIDDWRKVIAAQAASVRGQPEKWRWLALSTITRRPNWLRLMDAPQARGSPRGPVDPTTQDHEAENPF